MGCRNSSSIKISLDKCSLCCLSDPARGLSLISLLVGLMEKVKSDPASASIARCFDWYSWVNVEPEPLQSAPGMTRKFNASHNFNLRLLDKYCLGFCSDRMANLETNSSAYL